MSEPIDYEDLGILEIMVLRDLRNRATDLPVAPPMPSLDEIGKAVDRNYSKWERFIDVMWECVGEMVHDEFPQFREPEEG